MNLENPMILFIAAAVLVLVVLLIYIRKTASEPHTTNYKAFFILGIVWLPIGISTGNTVFWILGIVFLTIGLGNKSKWQDQPRWSELSEEQRRTKKILIAALTLLLLAGLAVYYLSK